MGHWTDDELGALLTDTFGSREGLADPDRAVRVADEVRGHPRRWPVMVAAASVAILIAATVHAVNEPDRAPPVSASSPPPTAVSPTPGPTDAANLRAAARESERVLRLVPLPPGARRLPGKPAGWPPDAGFGMSPSNRSLTRTAWYDVPLDVDAMQAFLLSHVPDGMAPGDGLGSSVGVRTYDYATPQPREPAAYTGPSLLVQWYATGRATVVRFDVVLASRRARTPSTYLTGPVTSVDIDRTVENHTGRGSAQTLPTVRLSADRDADRLSRLVRAFNGLYGAVVSTSLHSCPDQTETTTYTFVFHTGQGDVTYRWVDGCDPEITVARAGKPIGPHLDPGRLHDTLTRILGGSASGR